MGNNLTILQDHELRVDRDITAAARAVLHRRADLAIDQPDHLRSVDLDLAATSFFRFGRDRAVVQFHGRSTLNDDDARIPGMQYGPFAATGDFRMVRQRQAFTSYRNVAGPTRTEFAVVGFASALALDAGAVRQTHGAGSDVQHHVPRAAAVFAGGTRHDRTVVQG